MASGVDIGRIRSSSLYTQLQEIGTCANSDRLREAFEHYLVCAWVAECECFHSLIDELVLVGVEYHADLSLELLVECLQLEFVPVGGGVLRGLEVEHGHPYLACVEDVGVDFDFDVVPVEGLVGAYCGCCWLASMWWDLRWFWG